MYLLPLHIKQIDCLMGGDWTKIGLTPQFPEGGGRMEESNILPYYHVHGSFFARGHTGGSIRLENKITHLL